ncbi:aminodeoxychorismate lyase [Dyella nitratireducens]|uniref:Aminodeoxychorismate lyase n=1 Tax=Dyella nitratireducens TaxID=1849580 RepID=A0ABQ1FL26_9GAMM|nr:aminodeoxychorismate lyase [Dyella nitratireducens]GGA18131.1 aminodeoxychorismate lyase [Dyella nitratireducens]GLQ44697.1 aminodeoxychorismate lyase [Dyella nitratireducens]
MLLINGQPCDSVSALDRGLSYGDGLFETIRFEQGKAPLWSRHMQRLATGCERLGMPAPDAALIWQEAQQVTDKLAQCVLRITLTRGLGERGYAPPIQVSPTRIVVAFPMPVVSRTLYLEGVRLHRCHTTLADQPLLAGIKHLNRLEQVLARAEWSDPAISEGLVCDSHGNVISATAANLFAVIDGVLVTPSVDRCGVAGVARAAILEAFPNCQVRDVALDEGVRAAELFLSSSVRGILPVQAVGDTVYAPGPVVRAMQQHWRDLGFAMEQA